MDWKLEVVVVPVTDIDRAKQFYLDKIGFKLDADIRPAENFRVVHMTPPGSACSVVVGPAVVSPGTDLTASARMQLVVTDIDAARAELSGRGVDVSEVQILDARDGGKFFYFTDPDGNNWAVQEIRNYVGAPLDEPAGS
jgi:predicted enzyme related to lactoylglutathione lyase